MLLSWMAYSVVFTVLISLAAFASERVMEIWGWPRRFVWMTALMASAIGPVGFALRRGPPVERWSVNAPEFARLGRSRTTAASNSAAGRVFGMPRWRAITLVLDPYVERGWAAASLLLMLLTMSATLSLRRRRARWTSIELDGHRVLLSHDAGPAVVGAIRPIIVMPRWVLSLDASSRGLMLRHELEHIAARDPRALLAAVGAVVAFPWNAGLWLIARRLRLSIEVDCDRRVLRHSTSAHEYGMLLLAVGARRSERLPLAAALAARRPLLEQRIRAITMLRPSAPRALSAALAIAAVAAMTAAARAPRPAPLRNEKPIAPRRVGVETINLMRMPSPLLARPRDESAARLKRSVAIRATPKPSGAIAAPPPSRPELSASFIRRMIAEHQPTVLQGDTTVDIVMFVFDAQGNYVASRTEKERAHNAAGQLLSTPFGDDSTRKVVEPSAIKSVDVMKYRAGAMRDGPLGVIVVRLK